MALTSDNHVIDPQTGFAVDPETGHPIGLVQKPHLPVTSETEFPKWVIPDPSHIVIKKVEGLPDLVSTPLWAEHHVNRADGVVTVLVNNLDEESIATAPVSDDHREEADEIDHKIDADIAQLNQDEGKL